MKQLLVLYIRRRPNRNRKKMEGREEKSKNQINKKQERKKEGSTQGEYILAGSQATRGGCSTETKNNIIRHQGEQGSEKKSGEGDTRNKQKTTKRKEKTKRNGKTENDKKGKGKEGKRKTARRVSRAALC